MGNQSSKKRLSNNEDDVPEKRRFSIARLSIGKWSMMISESQNLSIHFLDEKVKGKALEITEEGKIYYFNVLLYYFFLLEVEELKDVSKDRYFCLHILFSLSI